MKPKKQDGAESQPSSAEPHSKEAVIFRYIWNNLAKVFRRHPKFGIAASLVVVVLGVWACSPRYIVSDAPLATMYRLKYRGSEKPSPGGWQLIRRGSMVRVVGDLEDDFVEIEVLSVKRSRAFDPSGLEGGHFAIRKSNLSLIPPNSDAPKAYDTNYTDRMNRGMLNRMGN